jgi:hypothetical protein
MGLQTVFQLRWGLPRFDPIQQLWARLENNGFFDLFIPQYIDPDDIGTSEHAPSEWQHMLDGEQPKGEFLTTSARPQIDIERLVSLYDSRFRGSHIGFHMVGSVARLHAFSGGRKGVGSLFCHLPHSSGNRHIPTMAMSIVVSAAHGTPHMLVTLYLVCEAWYVLPVRSAPEFPEDCVVANWNELTQTLSGMRSRDSKLELEADIKPGVARQLKDWGLYPAISDIVKFV